MNLYIRYFDSEILVTNVEDAIMFLSGIEEIGMNDKIANDVRDYFESDNKFPKRYKVRPKIYFIMIKTVAKNMQEFRDYRTNSVNKVSEDKNEVLGNDNQEEYIFSRHEKMQNPVVMALQTEKFGWYEGSFDFKRVVTLPNGKNEYRDTHFVVRCKAMSGYDCYTRIVEHLRDRVDSRSQFPSAKGKNFSFCYLGDCKPITEEV